MKSKFLLIATILILSFMFPIYAQNSTDESNTISNFIRIPDEDFNRQSLQTGETLNTEFFGYSGLLFSGFILGILVYVKLKKRK